MKTIPNAKPLLVLMALAASAGQAQFVPPAGYGGDGNGPGVAAPTDPTAPRLKRIPDAKLRPAFRVDPTYRRGIATGRVEIVGAFEIAERGKRRITAAWAPGFLPVTLAYDDGTCYSFTADYIGGSLSNGRMNRSACDGQVRAPSTVPPSPAPARTLTFVGEAWSHKAWVDPATEETLVTVRQMGADRPLFTADMSTIAIMAMDGPDYPGGNVTLLGRIGGRLMLVTLSVSY